ncbi:hypothetical protein ACOMHN_027700 [Nucella lapillus]
MSWRKQGDEPRNDGYEMPSDCTDRQCADVKNPYSENPYDIDLSFRTASDANNGGSNQAGRNQNYRNGFQQYHEWEKTYGYGEASSCSSDSESDSDHDKCTGE